MIFSSCTIPGISVAKPDESVGKASDQWASAQAGQTLSLGWSYLWIVPIRSTPTAPCFCLAGRIATEKSRAACRFPLTTLTKPNRPANGGHSPDQRSL